MQYVISICLDNTYNLVNMVVIHFTFYIVFYITLTCNLYTIYKLFNITLCYINTHIFNLDR